ncbi:DUF2905 domain-containing protein [bacterium]|nr:DUF2905 domain-containing protein [bacterium]
MLNLIGKFLIFFGSFMILLGAFLAYFPKIPMLGKLPGDIYIKKENFVFIFPITTSIVLSLVLSLLFYLFQRLFR